MSRLLFSKTGNAVWISHLDLMRVFQRCFRRAGLMLKHTQGFSPRAIVSIALPLSVGVDSMCELLDFELVGDEPQADDLRAMLNDTMPQGIEVLEVYEDGRKLRELTHLHTHIALEYDNGYREQIVTGLTELFSGASLVVEKHSKKGSTEVDILPMIKSMKVIPQDDHTILLDCVICAQNPTLNPALIVEAVERYLPEAKPDYAKSSRIAVLDASGAVFR